jgi:hypothetical protein
MTSAETLPSSSDAIPFPKKKLTKKPVFWVASAAAAFVMIAVFSSDTNTIPDFSAQAERPVLSDYDDSYYDFDDIAYAPLDENYNDGYGDFHTDYNETTQTIASDEKLVLDFFINVVSAPPGKEITCNMCNGGSGNCKNSRDYPDGWIYDDNEEYLFRRGCINGRQRNQEYDDYVQELLELAKDTGDTMFIDETGSLIGIMRCLYCEGIFRKHVYIGLQAMYTCKECYRGADFYFPNSIVDVRIYRSLDEIEEYRAWVKNQSDQAYLRELSAIYDRQAEIRRATLFVPPSSSNSSGRSPSGSSGGSSSISSPCARVDCSAKAESGKAFCSVHKDSMSSNQFCYDARCRNKPLAGSVYCATHK